MDLTDLIIVLLYIIFIAFFMVDVIVRYKRKIQRNIIGMEVRIIIRDYFKEQIDKLPMDGKEIREAEIDNILKYNKDIQILLKKYFGME